MKFIRKWSYSCAKSLTSQLSDSHEKRSVYYYGFQIVIGGIIKFAILILAAAALGILFETGVLLLFFGGLRTFAGGYHMDTYGRCMVTTLSLLLAGGAASKYLNGLWSLEALIIFTLIVLIIGLYAIIKWAPADTPRKRMTNKARNLKLKIASIVYIILWAGASVILSLNKLNMPAMAGCIGILLCIFIISPFGYKILDRLEGRKEPSWSQAL